MGALLPANEVPILPDVAAAQPDMQLVSSGTENVAIEGLYAANAPLAEGRLYGDRGRLGQALVRLYQRRLSPHTTQCPIPHADPSMQSCSEYGLQAIALNGNVRGGLMARRRVQACGAIASGLFEMNSQASVGFFECADDAANKSCPLTLFKALQI
jgi:putative component of membrane protein insertase Oxa1/YidC/SpoIIIJ protein YidD